MVIGIISEYNPFHKGHKYQIDKIKSMYPDSVVVAIMSGNVTQRGEFALFDKYDRAKSAILCGVDCVFELPYPFSASNAEVFARAGVHIASSVGVTHLCFGTESGNIDYVTDIADTVDSDEFQDVMKGFLSDKSISYSCAREEAFLALGKIPPLKSNDMLGVEYIRAIKKYASNLKVFTIKREGADYNDFSKNQVMSASAIREYFVNNNTIESTPSELDGHYRELVERGEYVNKSEAEDYLFRSVVLKSSEDLAKCYDMPSGAEYFVLDVAMKSKNSFEFFKNLTTKTYTYSRLRRTVIYSVLGTESVDDLPLYTTLLGANQRGRELLKNIRKTLRIPVITKLADYKALDRLTIRQFEESSRADRLYMTFLAEKSPSSYIIRAPFIF